jgi:hypothetical protein
MPMAVRRVAVVLTYVVLMSAHDLLPIALVLGLLAAGPFALAMLAKQLRLYNVAAICCGFGAAIAVLPPVIIFSSSPWPLAMLGRTLVCSRFSALAQCSVFHACP